MKRASAKETREAILNFLKKDNATIDEHNEGCSVFKEGMDDGLADCSCFCETECLHEDGHCTNCHDDCNCFLGE